MMSLYRDIRTKLSHPGIPDNTMCYHCICDIRYKCNAVYLFTHVHVDNGCLCARPGFCHFVCLLQNQSEATALKLEEIAIYNPREIWLHAYGFSKL